VTSCCRAFVRASRAKGGKKGIRFEFEILNLFGIWNFEF